ncbi:C-type mannose receptor 2-like protein [Labeo rohita]|uniref:C-type mannose receptor 2-like protein n=1 Tax=Labeo rohita TaxID=84645 RepID=A0A498NEE7_LABRO|nr:C-type mannose receptor 2-like protein [Labeo rohita]
MDRLFQLLFFSGFCSFTGGISREYVLIQEQKTWKQAQAYCRENHIDLATVQSDEDWANLREAVQVTKKAWIGLFNDINSWRWSYQNKEITFSSWSSGEPNNYGGYEACGLMQGRTWNDYNCNSLYPFICFEENGTNKFVFINNSKNWLEAQHYCRQYYTDLVIIQNQTELNEMTVIMKPYTSAWIGFCSFTGGTLLDYVLIQEQKTWDEAQTYCRKNYIDLATVQSTDDSANLQEAVYKMAKMAWIGLYNDINNWRWSYQDEQIMFQNWYTGEPNNYDGHEECGVMMDISTWNDWSCTALFPFFCYSENGTNRFVFISNTRTWKEAQHYCRQYYTDLAVIRNPTENNELNVLMKPYTQAWIGLFRDVWKWSLSPLPSLPVSTSFITWMTGQPDMLGLQRPCGVSDPTGLISDQLCSNVLPFLCTFRRKFHV